jgi:cyclopropane fatty-acyl-phospholipid synthase-like methyltransferase
MSRSLSPRLIAIVNALPLKSGMRVLEIGCGPGAIAREIARRTGDGHVLAIDRSATAIAQARAASQPEIAAVRLSFRQVAIEARRRTTSLLRSAWECLMAVIRSWKRRHIVESRWR